MKRKSLSSAMRAEAQGGVLRLERFFSGGSASIAMSLEPPEIDQLLRFIAEERLEGGALQ